MSYFWNRLRFCIHTSKKIAWIHHTTTLSAMTTSRLLLALACATMLMTRVNGHAALVFPPSRNAADRFLPQFHGGESPNTREIARSAHAPWQGLPFLPLFYLRARRTWSQVFLGGQRCRTSRAQKEKQLAPFAQGTGPTSSVAPSVLLTSAPSFYLASPVQVKTRVYSDSCRLWLRACVLCLGRVGCQHMIPSVHLRQRAAKRAQVPRTHRHGFRRAMLDGPWR